METSNSNTTPFTIALETSFVIDCLRAKNRELKRLLARYRDETPIGHQPHMIAHLVDEALGREHQGAGGEAQPTTPPVATTAEIARPTDDQLWDQTLSERDHYHEVADKLANAIAEHFSIEIGEHSSANCPWDNALNAIEERTYSDAEALRKDAERYRWLRDHSRVFKHRRFQPERYGNLDKDIDAAIEKHGGAA